MIKQKWSIAILILGMITIGVYSCSDDDDLESSSGTEDQPKEISYQKNKQL